MTDKPIIFSAPMVRALLDGTKTQTRRVLKPQPSGIEVRPLGFVGAPARFVFGEVHSGGANYTSQSPIAYGLGDRLWVRENWQGLSFGDYLPTKSRTCDLRYAATDRLADVSSRVRGYPWRPSIHMPRWASRLTLTVTDVRVQRLQEISEADIAAEGIKRGFSGGTHGEEGLYEDFSDLWDSINGLGAWDANPWVAAYTFTVKRGNIDQLEAAE